MSTPSAPNSKPDVEASPRDFRRLRSEGHSSGTSRVIGMGFVLWRDAWARGLVRMGVTPNMLTLLGAAFQFVAAACLVVCASDRWGLARAGGRLAWAAAVPILLFCSFACDMLDGAVARLGKLGTPLGAVLDSSIDRFSDMAIYLGIALHFSLRGNVTYSLLAMLALCNATLISYIKARAETLIPDCSPGYWMRGERCAAMLIAACSAHVPAVLWQQAILPALTVVRRLVWTYEVLAAQAAGTPPPDPGPFRDGRRWLAPWRFPRGSVPYDVVTGLNIAFILFAPFMSPVFEGGSDPFRAWLSTLFAAGRVLP